MSLPQSRARAIAGVKANFKASHKGDLSCRFCSTGYTETQEHLEVCGGTEYKRRGLDMLVRQGVLTFWTRMTANWRRWPRPSGRELNTYPTSEEDNCCCDWEVRQLDVPCGIIVFLVHVVDLADNKHKYKVSSSYFLQTLSIIEIK